MATNQWEVYSTAQSTHVSQPGAVYEDKIFIFDNSAPEVFDPIKVEWSSWPKPSSSHGIYSCLLTWRDSLVLMGGNTNTRKVEIFDQPSQSWSVAGSAIPIAISSSGCVVMPSEEILVLGSASPGFKKACGIYNVEQNTWQFLGETTYDRSFTSLVRLGDRTFAIGGTDSAAVEEFVYSDLSWIEVETELQVLRRVHSTLAVPADLFAHLPGGCQGIK